MLVAMRFAVPEAEADGFAERAGVALGTLAARPGYVRGELGRAYDDPTVWCLLTVWESVGSYRRALGAYEVKLHATPLLAQALDEPSAFEPLATATPGGSVVVVDSDRADSPLRSRP
ncbi:antibiotic biosynthesis monooxygenase family protein [Luedemannella helvata]|uniref:ABM domain-containing protein n=1 Tax=Luedemannella helvata TaxID=349315 RepID=A0ABP4X7V5_9ACTN